MSHKEAFNSHQKFNKASVSIDKHLHSTRIKNAEFAVAVTNVSVLHVAAVGHGCRWLSLVVAGCRWLSLVISTITSSTTDIEFSVFESSRCLHTLTEALLNFFRSLSMILNVFRSLSAVVDGN